MINIAFSEEEIDRLYEGQSSHENHRIRRKYLAVYLKSLGVEHAMICKICRISWTTMVSYLKEYRDGGIERITLNMRIGHPSEMNAHSQELKAVFEAKPPATLKEARAKITELTGLKRSIPQVWSFLRKIGLRPRMVGGIPGKVDVDEQEDFKKKNSNRDLKRRKPGSGKCIS